MADLTFLRELERALLDSWPAGEVEWHGGWALLANEGTTGRANSVTVISEPATQVAHALDFVEDWYRSRGLVPMVRVTPLSGPVLERELEARGYGSWPSPSHVMTRDLSVPEGARTERAADVQLSRHAPDGWWDLLDRSPKDRAVIRRMFEPMGKRSVHAAIAVDDTIAAIGHGVVTDGYLSVFSTHTLERYRRQGLALAILTELESWARSMGAHTSTLQVTVQNTGAQGLYERVGYESLYQYRYSRAPDPT